MLKKNQYPIAAVNAIAIIGFLWLFLSRHNYEFIFYVAVIVFFYAVILLTNTRVNYPNGLLWGLTLWGLMHMSGGGLYLGGTKLYEVILIPLSEQYQIFKYDQLVHIIGFGVATGVMWILLRPHLEPRRTHWTALSIVVIMAGLGVGALNEIIEFIATVITPETGVGGYENTSLDLIADLIGAIIAMAWIYLSEKKATAV